MQISDFSIRNPVKVAVGVILVSMFGLIAVLQIPVQLTPEVAKPTISVDTRWPGASPQEIEKEIVDRQEEQLKGIAGMVEFRSTSSDGEGSITMEFQVGTDLDAALVKVSKQLEQVREYPEDADKPRVRTVDTSNSPIAWFIFTPLPPTRGELATYVDRYPHLADVLGPLQRAAEVDLPTLTRLAEEHAELADLVAYRVDASRLRRFAEDTIEARLEQVEGVANSNIYGGRIEELRVVVDPVKLAARKITIVELRQALSGANKDTSAGDLWENKRRYVIRTLGQFDRVDQVENVIVARRDGAPVHVRDVATVRVDYKKAQAVVRQQGIVSMAINVQKEQGSNVLDVMAGVTRAVAQLNEGVLASRGLRLQQVYDETVYIRSATKLVRSNLFIGGALAISVLLLFLRSGRSTLVVALAIPISVAGTFLVIAVLGRSINVISLAGMAFAVGMVVDNAIVVLENIFSHYQRGASRFEAASRGTSEVWGAVLASTLTTMAVFLPVVFIQEQAGQLFRDIAIAISAGVAISLVVSLTVIPSAARRLLASREAAPADGRLARKPRPKRKEWKLDLVARHFVHGVVALTERLQAGRIPTGAMLVCCLLFAGGAFSLVAVSAAGRSAIGLAVAAAITLLFVPLAMRARRVAIVVMMIVLSIGLSLRLMPPAEYLPEGNRNLIIGMLMPPPGYNLDQMLQIGRQVEARLRPNWEDAPALDDPDQRARPRIESFFFVARGRSVFMGARTRDPTRAAELIPIFQAAIADIPGIIPIISQASLFERGLSGGRTIDIEITGPDLEALIELGGRVFREVSQMYPTATTGTFVRPIPSLDLGSPELHVRRNAEKASQRGVITTELGYTVNALVDGAYAGDYWHRGKKIDLVITAEDDLSARTQDVAQLPIGTPSGELVALGAVADLTLSSGPEQINRIDRQRSITIQVKPGPGIALEEAMARIEREVLAKVRQGGLLANGLYHLHLSGTADELKQMRQALSGRLLLAIVITYLLIAALYESFLYPLVIMVSVPMAAVGGFAGLRLLGLFTRQSFDTLTMLGFVILIGTVVNNAILIVNQALVLIRTQGMPHREAVAESVRGRIRPIFMSTSTTVLGMLPLVLLPGAGSELYRGLGSVVLGGLIVSTVFTLFLVPMLFTLTTEATDGLRRRLARRGHPTAGESVAAATETAA